MRFSTREDIDLPADEVFRVLSDFEGFERAAMRRGAEVIRGGDPGARGLGQSWLLHFEYRGKPREMNVEITRHDPASGIEASGRAGGLEGVLAFDLTSLGPNRTRLGVDLDVTPDTISARLLLQSLRLIKAKLTTRFKNRFRQFARALEARARAAPSG